MPNTDSTEITASALEVSLNAVRAGYELALAVLAGGPQVRELALKLKEHAEDQARDAAAHGAEISKAREDYTNDDCEIDDAPMVSVGDSGVWVNAWVWVEKKDEEEDEDEREEDEG